MYDAFKILNYPDSLVSPELFARLTSRMYTGDVVDGFTVTPGTGLKVILAPGNALVRYGSGATASARIVSLVDNFELSIETPDVSNPRIDLVVLYVDNDVELPDDVEPSSANLDGPGVAKAKIVKGAASSNPTAPNATAIQSAVGSNNPYTVLYEVRVDQGVSLIAEGKVTDKRAKAKLTPDKVDWATFPKAKVVLLSNVSIPNNAWTHISFDKELFDIGDMHNSSNPARLTAPVDGLYLINGMVRITSNTVGGRGLRFAKNSSAVDEGLSGAWFGNPSTVSQTHINISAVISLTAGDYITLQVFQNSGGSLNLEVPASEGGLSPSFSMARIS